MAPKRLNASTGGSSTLKQKGLFSFFAKNDAKSRKTTTTKPAAPNAASRAHPSHALNNNKNASSSTTTKQNSNENNNNNKTLLLPIGTRIDVLWKDDQAYYPARITKQKTQSDKSILYYLEYEDDGTCEWIDLSQETYRQRLESKKRRRIQDDNDDDDEFSKEAEFDDAEEDESAYEDRGDEEEEEEDDQWMVTDDEDEEVVAATKKSNKKRTKTTTTLKVTQHAASAKATPSSSRKKSSSTSLHHFGHTPQAVTPASLSSQTSPAAATSSPLRTNTLKSPPLSSTKPSTKPPAFVPGALNPAGSHVHNHLPFLQNPRDASGRTPDHPDYNPRTLQLCPADWQRVTGKKMTDAVLQWWQLKSQYCDSVLLFKTGKFYELFHMDADIGVQVLHLIYMKGHVAHAGFPEISYGNYADKLVLAGYKVARVEQTETPEQLRVRKKQRRSGPAPKVVNREVCSVMSLGTRTFCYLDADTQGLLQENGTADAVGPLLAIREVLVDEDSSVTDPEQVRPVCEYGITLVDAVRGTITIGQFADDVLRSRMTTLLTTFSPSEILLQGSGQASPTLQSLIRSVQTASPHPFRLEIIHEEESFPKSTALDAQIRLAMERSGRVHPWNVDETLAEVHRRKYYPRASKRQHDGHSVSRWPQVLRAAVEGKAELALSSFGAALYYLQRNLIDQELLSMGIVKAYVPPASSTVRDDCSPSSAIEELASQQSQTESGLAPQTMLEQSQASSSSSGRQEQPQSSPVFARQESLNLEDQVNHMALDGTTLHNLEILTNSVDYKVTGSLWSKINYTKTPHGSRLLRAWLLRPLFRRADIERRADAVEELVSGAGAVSLSEARSVLQKCGDIERLLSRVHSMSGGAGDEDGIHPKDRAILYETGTYTKRMVGDFSRVLNGLRCATQIPEIFDGVDIGSGLLRKIVCHAEKGGCFPDMVEELDFFFSNFDCDQAAKGLFEPSRGVDAMYDEACETIERIHADLEDYKNEMCSECLAPSSRAKSSWKYANTKPESKDKYLIELPASIPVPEDFIMKGKRGSGHKQVNKYRTAVVHGLVDELERALDVQKDRKAKGMQLIFAKFDAKRSLWAAAAQATALLDALSSLAQVASKSGFTRPTILDCPPDGSPSIKVSQGRHPCVENTLGSTEFVPNDLCLGSPEDGGHEPRVLLLSGPNMGGKSTLLRQTCLIAILAQIGSFVPAESCELTPLDRIFTRLGASDRLLLGQSTFFVELAETAAALRGATRRSLVIMDELGRGTSTFDGTAIASAAVKHLVERCQCLSLFATHYHSLLEEWKDVGTVKLGHMECVVDNGKNSSGSGEAEESNITFLYTLGTGVCPKSFGINVARLAGLPEEVLVNAKRISSDFEVEMNSDENQSKALTAKTAHVLKGNVLDFLERGDWEQMQALWEKLRN